MEPIDREATELEIKIADLSVKIETTLRWTLAFAPENYDKRSLVANIIRCQLDTDALVDVLIKKGIFTQKEYHESLIGKMDEYAILQEMMIVDVMPKLTP